MNKAHYKLDDLLEIMRRLRDPDGGCPWDLEQDFATITPYTIEEAYEVAECISEERWQDLPSELGDLLFQVVFYAQLAQESAYFGFDEILQAICEKMVRRHPHVFADVVYESMEEQSHAWEDLKKSESPASSHLSKSLMDEVDRGLPELLRAKKLQKKAAKVGFDWPDSRGVYDKLSEEITELQGAAESGKKHAVETELGDVFFTLVNLSRHLDVDPGHALRLANAKFEQRFRTMEANGEELSSLSAEELEQLWLQAKKGE